jgi:uncharacterized protein YcbK (DUF882 family)
MSMSRRVFLRAASGVVATTAASSFTIPAFAKIASPAVVGINETACRTLVIECLRSGERLKADYWIDGREVEAELARLNKALRDLRTGEVHVIEPKLLDLMYRLGRELDVGSGVQVISAYRSPATNAMLHKKSSGVAVKSLHMKGQAIDLRVPGRQLDQVHRAAIALAAGGVGNYPKSNFVHVDTGRVRRWMGS